VTDRIHYTPFDGGVDLITPATQIKPGRLLAGMNYECPVEGGYRAIDGYAQIGDPVPGEGSVLGVAVYDDGGSCDPQRDRAVERGVLEMDGLGVVEGRRRHAAGPLHVRCRCIQSSVVEPRAFHAG
jgi:hypothetical protein